MARGVSFPLRMDAPEPVPLHFTYSLTLCQAQTPTIGDHEGDIKVTGVENRGQIMYFVMPCKL